MPKKPAPDRDSQKEVTAFLSNVKAAEAKLGPFKGIATALLAKANNTAIISGDCYVWHPKDAPGKTRVNLRVEVEV